MSFKIKQRVRIIDDSSGHEFSIGEEVTLSDTDKEGCFDWVAMSDDGKEEWYIYECDIEKID